MMALFQGFGKILNFRWFTVHQCRKSVPLGLGMKTHFCVADVTILVVNGVDIFYIYVCILNLYSVFGKFSNSLEKANTASLGGV